MLFSEKSVLITGGTSGLGLCLAKQFVQQGAEVVICGRSAERGSKAAKLSGARFLAIDLCDLEQVDNLFDFLRRHFSQLDIAVNNAGIARSSSLLEQSEEDWQETINTNLTAVWRCMKWEVRLMLEQICGGSIVNMSSIAGVAGVAANLSAYAASKHGVVGLTRSTALEYARHNIRINALCPARICSHPTDDDGIPMGRTGIPAEVVNAVFFLASDQSSYITGQALPLDGGLTAR